MFRRARSCGDGGVATIRASFLWLHGPPPRRCRCRFGPNDFGAAADLACAFRRGAHPRLPLVWKVAVPILPGFCRGRAARLCSGLRLDRRAPGSGFFERNGDAMKLMPSTEDMNHFAKMHASTTGESYFESLKFVEEFFANGGEPVHLASASAESLAFHEAIKKLLQDAVARGETLTYQEAARRVEKARSKR